MVLCGMVQYGMYIVWYGIVWYGMVWYDEKKGNVNYLRSVTLYLSMVSRPAFVCKYTPVFIFRSKII